MKISIPRVRWYLKYAHRLRLRPNCSTRSILMCIFSLARSYSLGGLDDFLTSRGVCALLSGSAYMRVRRSFFLFKTSPLI